MTIDADTACFHCGEPVPLGCELAVEIDGAPRPMCCPGCLAVASLISGSGLESFYRLRTGFSQRPEQETSAAAYSIYDKAENSQDFVEELADGSRRGRLLLGGVSCAACTWLIESALQREAGISGASVNLARQTLSVDYDPARVRLSEIFLHLEQLGYEPHPWHIERGAELLQQEQRSALRELAVAGLAMMQVGMFAIALHAGEIQGIADEYRSLLRWVSLLIATVVVGYSARSFFRNAWQNLRHARLVMDLPVALAIGLAYLASAWATLNNSGQVYFDSIAMFTFFLLLGRFLERRVRQREFFRQTDLQSLLPNACLRASGSGWDTIATREARRGDRLLLKAGEVIPADGTIISGTGSVDEGAFSGEHLPRRLEPGSIVSAGTLLCEGTAEMRVTADPVNTRLATMLKLMGRAEQRKPRLALLADRVAGWFVAAVLLIAGTVAAYWYQVAPERALWISLSVLVVSCPCALALATPVALASATAALRRRGLLLTGENALQAMNQCSLVLFDKTGTLTQGNLRRKQIRLRADKDEKECLAIAAALELRGNHPIAAAFADIDSVPDLAQIRNLPGRGIQGELQGSSYAIGSTAFISELVPGLESQPEAAGHWIALADERRVLAWIEISDTTRPEAGSVVSALQDSGRRVELLTGDHSDQGRLLAAELAMDDVHSGCSPEQKLEYIQQLQAGGRHVAMVGDGLNDAPVLASADCSFAVNQATDLAKSRADAILINTGLDGVLAAFAIARRSRAVVQQNMAWALGYNLLALPLAAMGMIPPWAAAIGMSASSLLVVLNSLRLK